MRKYLLLPILFFYYSSAYSQQKNEKFQYRLLAIDIGMDNTAIQANAVSEWALAHGQKAPGRGLSGHLSISYLSKHFGGGIEEIFPDPYRVMGVFFGYRLTPHHGALSSWLNFQIGDFDALYNQLKPANYSPTPDQQGKQLQLQYNNGYIGLDSKSYWTHHHKKPGSTILGVELLAGYTAWRGSWSYGYYVRSGKSSRFVSNPVYGMPSPANLFLNVGLLCGLASR